MHRFYKEFDIIPYDILVKQPMYHTLNELKSG